MIQMFGLYLHDCERGAKEGGGGVMVTSNGETRKLIGERRKRFYFQMFVAARSDSVRLAGHLVISM